MVRLLLITFSLLFIILLETVYISPDMTKDQRVAHTNLVTELKTKRNNRSELKFFIQSGKIVSESREVEY